MVVVAMVGTGWAGSMHARSYQKICGVAYRLKTVCSLEPDLCEFAQKYHFETYTANFDDLLQDEEIDIIDIVTPPALHFDMLEKAIKAGKHVICEKPLTGYFGHGNEFSGEDSKEEMFKEVTEKLNRLEEELKKSRSLLCYAENWIYSPPFVRMVELVKEKKTDLLAIYGHTGHKGSHADHAAKWAANGGGTLIRQGTHPIAAALYLKKQEMLQKGQRYGIKSVVCDCGCLAGKKSSEEKKALAVKSYDVEDWAHLLITFVDGTKASISSGDIFLSQIYNKMEVYGNDAVYRVNMTPNNLLETYWADDRNGENTAIMEKNDKNIGWQDALVIEDVIRGYVGQLQDFLECVADGRMPRSDFALAKDTLLVVYAAYLSAEAKRTIELDTYLS